MKKLLTKTSLTALATALSVAAFAGNKDRSGQAGATELLVNPWAISSGVFGANTSNVQGIEAMKGNIAGLAFVNGTDIGASYNIFMKGSNVNVYNLAFGQKFGDFGVLGVNIQSMNFGEITITDYDNPQGGIGTYKPSFFNAQVGFAKEFSHSIHAGVGVTFVSEQITDARASGACFEAGVQYLAGAQDNFHFGVTLRNVGTNMKFSGEGFAFDSQSPGSLGYDVSRVTPTQTFEMPTYLNIGTAYDFYLGSKSMKKVDEKNLKTDHRLTAMLAFTSNSFNNDYIHLGAEYSFKERFQARVGYRYEKDILDNEKSTTFYRGFSAGASVLTSMGEKGRLAIDYAYRPTHRPDNGVHNISLRVMLNKKSEKAAEE